MKKFLMNKKRNIISAATLIVGTILCVGVTMSYYKASGELTNQFTVGNVTTEIEETFTQTSDTVYAKDPKVVNTGESDCIVRMRATISPSTQEANLDIDYDIVNWELKSDGYYYYKGVVKANQNPPDATAPLFTTVTIMNPALMESFDIILYQEAVQAEAGNGTTTIKAFNTDGSYNATEAAKIWAIYDAAE